MKRTWLQSIRRRMAFLAVLLLALSQGGCLWVAAGAAAGGVVGYAYHEGKMCQTYLADLGDVRAATHAALAELGMPIEQEECGPDGGFIKTRSGDGEQVRIQLEKLSSRVPADGLVTRVCVRVGTFGDHPLSMRLLYQIGAHLIGSPAACSPPMPVMGPPSPTLPPPTPAAGTPPSGAPAMAPPPRAVEPPLAR